MVKLSLLGAIRAYESVMGTRRSAQIKNKPMFTLADAPLDEQTKLQIEITNGTQTGVHD